MAKLHYIHSILFAAMSFIATETVFALPPQVSHRAVMAPNFSNMSHITRMASLGDSFTTGIDAGKQMGFWLSKNWWCARYTHAYSLLVHNDLRFGDPKDRDFHFESCTGHDIDVIRKKQLPNMEIGAFDVVRGDIPP
jgi:hypothetical protein